MYKQKILNDFYEELFCTDFNDYESPTQNAKTDNLCDDHNMSFEDWTEDLIDTFVRDNDYTKEEVKQALDKEPKFLEDLKEEYEYLKEVISEDDEDYEEDED